MIPLPTRLDARPSPPSCPTPDVSSGRAMTMIRSTDGPARDLALAGASVAHLPPWCQRTSSSSDGKTSYKIITKSVVLGAQRVCSWPHARRLARGGAVQSARTARAEACSSVLGRCGWRARVPKTPVCVGRCTLPALSAAPVLWELRRPIFAWGAPPLLSAHRAAMGALTCHLRRCAASARARAHASHAPSRPVPRTDLTALCLAGTCACALVGEPAGSTGATPRVPGVAAAGARGHGARSRCPVHCVDRPVAVSGRHVVTAPARLCAS